MMASGLTSRQTRGGAKRAAPEQALQRAIVQWMTLCLPPQVFWTAINPVPAKSKAAAGISKALGMRAGVPDILVIYQGKAVLFELKAAKGYQSDTQRDVANQLNLAGSAVRVARSIEDVVAGLNEFGIPHMQARAA
jgi:hypothetical protein